MAYCRFDEGDVYVWEGERDDGTPVWVCTECLLRKADPGGARGDLGCLSRADMLKHLWIHRWAGHKVPDHAFTRLRAELK